MLKNLNITGNAAGAIRLCYAEQKALSLQAIIAVADLHLAEEARQLLYALAVLPGKGTIETTLFLSILWACGVLYQWIQDSAERTCSVQSDKNSMEIICES